MEANPNSLWWPHYHGDCCVNPPAVETQMNVQSPQMGTNGRWNYYFAEVHFGEANKFTMLSHRAQMRSDLKVLEPSPSSGITAKTHHTVERRINSHLKGMKEMVHSGTEYE